MAGSVNRQILLKSRPEGAPSLGNFELTETPTPEPGEGEVLMRSIDLSLDPYMRGRMSAAKSYATPAAIGHPMVGGTVGEIVKSRNPKYSVGDIVLGYGGWQEYALSNGAGLRKLDPTAAPVSTALGVLGMPGMTAYIGLLEIGQPKPGETVVVAAASGAVGSVVGQVAKIKDAMQSGSPAALRSAASLPASWALMLVSIIARPILQSSSKPLVPRELTFISRMSAAPYSKWCGRCSTILRAFPYAGSSRSTMRRLRCPGPTCFRCCANASSCVGSSSRISPRNKPISCVMSANGCAQVASNIARTSSKGWGKRPHHSLVCCRVRISARCW